MSEQARLRWLCRRGMKELDELLVRFLEQSYPAASAAEQRAFERLLELQDPDLYALVAGREESDDADIDAVVRGIRRAAFR